MSVKWCVVSMKHDDATRRRLLCSASEFDVFTQVASLYQHHYHDQQAQTGFFDPTLHFTIAHCRNKKSGRQQDIHFINICGKVTHCLTAGCRQVHYPSVLPCIQRVNNEFGCFDYLMGVGGNLLTNTAQTFTLFRGGSDMQAIQTMIQFCLRSECIAVSTMHMIVANFRLGRPIDISSNAISNAFLRDPNWTAVAILTHEDMNFLRGFTLTNFNAETMTPSEQQPDSLYLPTQIRVLITICGNVNCFVTVDNLPIEEHTAIKTQVNFVLQKIQALLLDCT